MGYIKHNTMTITGYGAGKEEFMLVFAKAKELFGSLVSDIVVSQVNGFNTFIVSTSGSYQGWEEDTQHNDHLKILADYIDSFRFEDNSNLIQFVQVTYDERYRTAIERSNNR